MAIHASLGLAAGWPFPSVATYLAGILASLGVSGAPAIVRRCAVAVLLLSAFLPAIVPTALGAAALAAMGVGPLRTVAHPLGTLSVTLPSLTLLVLAFVVPTLSAAPS